MQFDGNRAWQSALAAIGANRAVLVPVAGVFFLLPAMASAWLMPPEQLRMIQDMATDFGQFMRHAQAYEDVNRQAMPVSLLTGLVQLVGVMTVLGILTDRRPTVGEAIGTGVKGLPSLIAAILITLPALLLATLVAVNIAAPIGLAAGPMAALVLTLALLLAGPLYLMARLSLTLPTIIIEGGFNPFKALTRSWRLTRGNGFRLVAFYLLLLIAYIVVVMVSAMVFGLLVMALQSAIRGESVILIVIGLLSGVLGGAFNLLLSAILAAIHRQMAGPSDQALADTFR